MNISIKNLNKSYQDKLIFDDFNCEFEDGMVNALIGESGSGKTTLLRIMMGLEDYQGQVINLPDNISVVFQEDRLLENRSVYDNLNFIFDEKLDRKEVESYLKKINLDGIIDKKVRNLSGGMKRRIAILRALLKDADLYILDEPFKEIDEKNLQLMVKLFEETTENKTVIMTSHDMDQVRRLADRMVVIDRI